MHLEDVVDGQFKLIQNSAGKHLMKENEKMF